MGLRQLGRRFDTGQAAADHGDSPTLASERGGAVPQGKRLRRFGHGHGVLGHARRAGVGDAAQRVHERVVGQRFGEGVDIEHAAVRVECPRGADDELDPRATQQLGELVLTRPVSRGHLVQPDPLHEPRTRVDHGHLRLRQHASESTRGTEAGVPRADDHDAVSHLLLLPRDGWTPLEPGTDPGTDSTRS